MGTVKKGADLTIYCISYILENWFRRNRKYPTKVYVQCDGGAENANKFLLGFLELLVAKRMAKTVLFTRLPTGHTHEDVDAMFGTIYNSFKGAPAETLDSYENVIVKAFKNENFIATVKDVYVCPSYKSYLKPHIDPELKGRVFLLSNM